MYFGKQGKMLNSLFLCWFVSGFKIKLIIMETLVRWIGLFSDF